MPRSRVPKSMLEKKEVIDWIERNGEVPTRAVAHFQNELGWKISGAQVRYWWKKKESIKKAPIYRSRLQGAGARPRLADLEDVLYDQVIYMRTHKEKVTREWIQASAQRMVASELHDPDFVASSRWLDGFMRRYDLSLRRPTNLTVLTDDVLTDRAVKFMDYLTSKVDALDLGRTVLMDETAVYFEDPRRQTVDVRGARHVVLKSTGFSSMRVTAVLAVTATGRKLPPLVVWKGARQDDVIERHGNVRVVYQKKAWVDSQLLQRWLDLIFPPILDTATRGKAVVWDSMRAHISTAVKARFAKKNIQMFVIPGGLTPYLQAGDIGIYKSFKDQLSGIIDEWKGSDSVQYTRGGNPRPPSVDTVAEWVNIAWREVPDDVVQRSVEAAGFSESFREWHIAKHDVYGDLFCNKWLTRGGSGDASDADSVAEVNDDFDEFTIWDEEASL